ncbi:hypothetical protein [Romboutsia lituseburensis]|uniref:Uncharacterized protein n=1 Tax=Romboutsia lituseburensis DSM 797 TaxID=1121325 RepID=A0A1G9TZB0_9FIRM|nr:hypothetical protein [Romboutsia lituseburensis]CEH34718.1 Hypothetical protein RLITU_2135 [Romboutsia lituseburensis]SDM53012.1 hypothetical protein SAMN04515677_11427 [Romboutsia lituseburensis DSM 797]
MEEIQELKIRLREDSSPFFTEEELDYYLKQNNNDLDLTTYECLLLKAEDDSISLPGGLQLANNSKYWLRLAKQYKPKKRSLVL